MKQLYFGSTDLPRFGILHTPPEGVHGDLGVVIVPPFANEYFRSYRSLKVLSDRIAKLGFPVFRFDYTGTGDSGGDDQDMSLARWREDLADSLSLLGKETGVSRFQLVGRRLGAAMSLEAAAARSDIERVVLWDPIPSGKEYLEEIVEEHRTFVSMYRGVHGSIRESEDSPFRLEALGQCFPGAFVDELEAWDLRRGLELGSVNAMFIDTTERGELEPYCRALAAAGATVEYQHVHDPARKEPTNPIRVYIPNRVLRTITDGFAAVAS
ncbi:MAG: hypothetical protein H8E31_14540 [Planctomycetes bacterium]|nr:hypothetical protein [Planctomycetota bacterium]